MALTSRSMVGFLDALRSADPTPGGGSAAALAGALGAALLQMVASLPRPAAGTAADRAALADLGRRCGRLCDELTLLVDRDSDAYDGVMAAYRLPSGTEAEKGERRGRIQQALAAAAETPLEVMRCCAEAAALAADVARLGNPSAASDAGVARELLAAGLRGARLNVEINLEQIEDRGLAERMRAEIARLAGP